MVNLPGSGRLELLLIKQLCGWVLLQYLLNLSPYDSGVRIVRNLCVYLTIKLLRVVGVVSGERYEVVRESSLLPQTITKIQMPTMHKWTKPAHIFCR
mgnify:CR=1 FL=1